MFLKGHRSGCDIRGHRFWGGGKALEGHRSEYDIMIGHGFEGGTQI